MKLAFAMLADAAYPDEDGRLTIHGAGLETLTSDSFPTMCRQITLIARLEVSPAECGYEHHLRIPLLDPDGREVCTLEAPLRSEQNEIDSYRAVSAPLVAVLPNIPFHAPGDYAFHILVDGFELDTIALFVRQGLQPLPRLESAGEAVERPEREGGL